jgi:hypothetical protein
VKCVLFLTADSSDNLKKHLKKIKIKLLSHNRSIPTRKTFVHSIFISEVKDMRNFVLQAIQESYRKNNV